MGNKSVIQNEKNGYVCNTDEDYANRIRSAMKKFPEKLPEAAYEDVLKIYNTDVMKKKFVCFYQSIAEQICTDKSRYRSKNFSGGYKTFSLKSLFENSDILWPGELGEAA